MRADPLHVIIVGAGYGGLALAHGLHRAGVSFAVYEAQRSRTDGLYGYNTPLEAIADYEAEMIPYGFARVADSLARNGTSGSDPLHKPFIYTYRGAEDETGQTSLGDGPSESRERGPADLAR
jgi:glycine/D-amino acid oxidase-like deaminating enzyme